MEYKLTDMLEAKKTKAACHSMRQWLFNNKEFGEITIAKFMSSVLVHALIDVEACEDSEEAVDMAMGYHTDLLATMVHNLICGMTTPEICRRILLDIVREEGGLT